MSHFNTGTMLQQYGFPLKQIIPIIYLEKYSKNNFTKINTSNNNHFVKISLIS